MMMFQSEWCVWKDEKIKYYLCAVVGLVYATGDQHHHVRLTTCSVRTSNAPLASLSGKCCRISSALSAYAPASSLVRSTPDDRRTRSRAWIVSVAASQHKFEILTNSTSPSFSNFRAMRAPISACSSHAYSAGPVASPSCRSAPPGFPSADSPDS
jgi:hypothetical protein